MINFYTKIYFHHSKKELGGGTVLDIGVYAIQVCQFVFQEAPKSITATGTLNDDGVDLEMSAQFNYGNGKVARIQTTALDQLGNTAKITGTKGAITVRECEGLSEENFK